MVPRNLLGRCSRFDRFASHICLPICLPKILNVWDATFLGVGCFVRGPVMDTRRSFYLASRRDDFVVPAPDESLVDLADIPHVTAANDNVQTKERLSARCGALLRRLIALHGLS
jgi:hypothetical protein